MLFSARWYERTAKAKMWLHLGFKKNYGSVMAVDG